MEKDFLYLGKYIDTQGRYLLKIGATNNLQRREKEHSRNYQKVKNYQMAPNTKFTIIWSIPLSKYNTLRYEDKNIQIWKEKEVGTFVRNDRFCFEKPPISVQIAIRKNYRIFL